MSESPPADARLVHHHRDEALDQPWGEGHEVRLFESPDGRWFLESTFTHIDADGPRTTAGWVAEERAIEALARHGGGAVLVERFPGSWQARTHALCGTCDISALSKRAPELLKDAEAIDLPGAMPAAELLSRSPLGIYLHQRGGAWSALTPDDARKAMLRLGASTETLAKHFPASAEVALLRKVGAAGWPVLEAGGFEKLLSQASELYTGARDETSEGWIREESLFRIDPALHVLRRRRVARPAPEHEVFDRVDALLAMRLMPEVTDEAKRAAFPDEETWRLAQLRAGFEIR